MKYQGLGNDFILVDNRGAAEPCLTPAQARSVRFQARLCLTHHGAQAVRLCDRNFGIGGDGVIFALPPAGEADFGMRIFNSDGSEPEMCGNGIRCLARFVAALEGGAPRRYRVSTGAGMITPEVLASGLVSVDMGVPVLAPAAVPCLLPASSHPSGAAVAAALSVGVEEWRVTAVSMGNPHAVVFAGPRGEPLALDALPLATLGPLFEHHAAFPRRTNTEFVEVLSRDRLRMVVWERGAGATLACGTGACATVVAAVLEGRAERRATVELPGGPLDIHWRCALRASPTRLTRGRRESDGRVIMTGPAEAVFSGETTV